MLNNVTENHMLLMWLSTYRTEHTGQNTTEYSMSFKLRMVEVEGYGYCQVNKKNLSKKYVVL